MAAVHLPWFGSLGDESVPQFTAVSETLWRHGPVPGAQDWGYLIAAWSVLIVVWALGAAFACAFGGARNRVPIGPLLLGLAIASVVAIVMVVAEMTASAQFDLVSYAHTDWGAWIGLSLAVMSSLGAWLAWATWCYPYLWGRADAAQLSIP